jgi:hypothetical protein
MYCRFGAFRVAIDVQEFDDLETLRGGFGAVPVAGTLARMCKTHFIATTERG